MQNYTVVANSDITHLRTWRIDFELRRGDKTMKLKKSVIAIPIDIIHVV